MKILNARLNHANNSSSSHSVIIAGSASGPEAKGAGDFGWEEFLQITKKDKMNYMLTQLRMQLDREFGSFMGRAIATRLYIPNAHINQVENYLGIDPEKDENGEDYEYMVDHQSEITIPRTFNGQPNIEFYKEMSDALINDDTAHIRGGNDNNPPSDPGKDHSRWDFLSALNEKGSCAPIARKQNGIWTLYSKGTGVKVHLCFQDQEIQQKTYRAETPELVDLKITDYCAFGCDYCYQDSTKEGTHAKFDDLRTIGYELQKAEVFEVALGGGETTQYPQFCELLELYHSLGITPNFTTKSLAWYKDEKIAAVVLKYCGSYAFSIDDASIIPTVLEHHKKLTTDNNRYSGLGLSFQYIPDAHPMETLIEVVKAIPSYGGSLTLLGYKNVGRGKSGAPYQNKGWLEKIRNLYPKDPYKLPTIAIDTQLASQYEDELKSAKIPEKLYYKEEGRFSMYVDAVAKKSGKSSYHEQYKSWTSPYEALREFGKFP